MTLRCKRCGAPLERCATCEGKAWRCPACPAPDMPVGVNSRTVDRSGER